MNPAPPSAPAPVAEKRGGLALRSLALGLGAAAVAVAAAAAYAGSLLAGHAQPGLAAAGAAIGVLVAAVPLGWLMTRLAAQAAPPPAASTPPAGIERPLFLTLAQREFARARRYGIGAALLIVQVDRYARLCDARGAAAGEAVLLELLHQTAPTLRTADVLTHHAEGQMAVFLAHADATGALDVAERIRERAEQLLVAQPEPSAPLRLTVSVGVACLRAAHPHLQSLVEDADEALQAARQAGGNCVRAAPVEGPARVGASRQRRAQPRQDGAA